VTLDLCARLSTGRPFPDGTPCPEPGYAVVLEAEDTVEETIRPRLLAAGADVDRVIHVRPEVNDLGEPLQFPAHLDELDKVVAQTKAKLVVISPIGAFLDPSVISENHQSVRRALHPLARMAEKHQCSMVLHRHLTKSAACHAMYRGGGSMAFIATCRSAWLIGRDPEKPARYVLAQVKNNLAAAQPSLAFEIQLHDSGHPMISWQGTSPWSANQLLLATGREPKAAPARDRAAEFLADVLADGPKTSREVWTAAQEAGLSRRTIERARTELEIRCPRVMLDKKRICYWLLPGQSLAGTVPSGMAPVDLEPWLEPLRKEFPPSTPLDDM
jgi:hypothetical protein